MKKSVLLSLFCLFLWQGVLAQGAQVKLVPGLNSSNSTIREWQNGQSVGYATDASGNHYFILITANSSTVATALLPTNLKITDFRILHDTMYFCGVDNSNNFGIVGFCNLSDLFSGTDGIKYGHLHNSTVPGSPYVTYPRRMDLYTAGGNVHVAFVGEMYDPTPNTPFPIRSTAGSVTYNGIDWVGEFCSNVGYVMEYTDVATSGPHAVVAAKKHNSYIYYAHVLNTSANLMSNQLLTGYAFEMPGNTPLGDILVEALSDHDYAMAYHFGNTIVGTEIQVIHVDAIAQQISVQNTVNMPHGTASLYSSSWSMKQMCYDIATHQLLLLQDACDMVLPSIESSVYKFDMANLSLGTAARSCITGSRLDKLDAKAGGGYLTIGRDAAGTLIMTDEGYQQSTLCRFESTPNYTLYGGTPTATRWNYTPSTIWSTPYNNTLPLGVMYIEDLCIE